MKKENDRVALRYHYPGGERTTATVWVFLPAVEMLLWLLWYVVLEGDRRGHGGRSPRHSTVPHSPMWLGQCGTECRAGAS